VARIGNRSELPVTPGVDRALNCIEAGIRAADPATIETGPTGTNVNDLRVLVLPA